MKKGPSVSLLALFLWSFLSYPAANCLAGNRQAAADPISTIRQQYSAINQRLAKYKKVRKKLLGFSLEGGELVAYFDGAAIVKIAATYYGEGGKSSEEYYYGNGELIFVFRKEQRYDKPLSGRVVRTEESRFYFGNDQLLRWIDGNGKQVSPGTTEFQENQDEYLKTSSTFLGGARSKISTIEADSQ